MRISISVIALGVISIACNNLQVNAGPPNLSDEDSLRVVTHLRKTSLAEGGYKIEEYYNTGSIDKYYILPKSAKKEGKPVFDPWFFMRNPEYTTYEKTKHRDGTVSDLVFGVPFEGPLLRSSAQSVVNNGDESQDEGTETCIVKPGFSNTASSMSDIDGDTEDEGTETRIVYPGFSNTASSISDRDGDTEDEGTVTRIVNPGFSNTSSASNMGDNDSGIDKEEIEKAWAEEMVSSIPSTALILKPRMTLSSFVNQTSPGSEADASLSKGKEKTQARITVSGLKSTAEADKKVIRLESSNSRALSILKSKILEARSPSNPPSVFRAWRDRRADIKEVGRGYYTKYYYPIYTRHYYPKMTVRFPQDSIPTETVSTQKTVRASDSLLSS